MAWSNAEWESELGDTPLWDVLREQATPGTFGDAYTDNGWGTIFSHWLQSEFSSENYNFLAAVDQFTSSGNQELAREIYQTFVVDNAPQSVNLTGAQFDALNAAFAPGTPVAGTVFNAARTNIFTLLTTDSYPRFVQGVDALRAAQGWGEPAGASVPNDAPALHAGGQDAPPGLEEAGEGDAPVLEAAGADGVYAYNYGQAAGDDQEPDWDHLEGRERHGGYGYEPQYEPYEEELSYIANPDEAPEQEEAAEELTMLD